MSIVLTRREEFAVLTIDRPEALNALSFKLIGDLEIALAEVAKLDCRALLITGSGTKSFCAGADIGELVNHSPFAHKRGVEFGQRVFSLVAALPMLSVAVVNGFAFGGGLELALACTFRLATPNARLGLPEIKLGLIPGYGGTQRLPRLIGESRAMDMILSGRSVKADEALRIGLVDWVLEGEAENPLPAAMDFARAYTGYSMRTLQLARSAVQRSADTTLNEGLRIEADLSTQAYQSEDAAEGMDAFVAKRKPVFRDRYRHCAA
jgi:enoyl-CoA hydratase